MNLEFAFVIDLKIIIYLFFFTCLFILLKYVTYIYYKKEHIQEILYDNVTIILSLSFTCINCDSGGGG